MTTDRIIVRGNKWRAASIGIVSGSIGILICYIFVMKKPAMDAWPLVIGYTIGTLLAELVPFMKKYDFVLTPSDVEGPCRTGIRVQRQLVPLHAIDLSGSRLPSFFKSGYLKTRSGSKIFFYWPYITRNQAIMVFKEISSHLKPES